MSDQLVRLSISAFPMANPRRDRIMVKRLDGKVETREGDLVAGISMRDGETLLDYALDGGKLPEPGVIVESNSFAPGATIKLTIGSVAKD